MSSQPTKNSIDSSFFITKENQAIVQVCKQEKTTVTGALNAAMLIAFKKTLILSNKKDLYVNTIIGINLRKIIESELANPENLGCLASSGLITFSLSDSEDFWKLARASRGKIECLLQKERPFQHLFLAKERIKLLKQEKEFPVSFCLSNLGKINLKETYGNLELLEVRATISLRGHNSMIMSHFITFRDSLHITFSYTKPLISTQKVEQLINCFVSIIEANSTTTTI